MQTPWLVVRYGQSVWETPGMDMLRRENCMCHHCANFKPGEDGHCPIAARFYEICKEHGTAFILTRCDSWAPPPGMEMAPVAQDGARR